MAIVSAFAQRHHNRRNWRVLVGAAMEELDSERVATKMDLVEHMAAQGFGFRGQMGDDGSRGEVDGDPILVFQKEVTE